MKWRAFSRRTTVAVHEKPKAFYETFERKGPGQKVTHYCPGCGHGTVHKLIAEAIDDLGIQDRTVFLSPVGCAAFAYYYFDTGNVACAHGRAPAVATGIRRNLDDAVVISYQGDGDLAGIGTAEIVHAANRGENLTVFFINNAIYGMTGGQMAPTTLLSQVTMTTPLGRTREREGPPIRICEMLSQLEAPVYIERVALTDAKGVLKTRAAVRKALRIQVEGRGFSLVEILSPCPVNWRMSPAESRKWIEETMIPVFPLGVFTDVPGQKRASGRLPLLGDAELRELLGADGEEGPVTEISEIDEKVKLSGFGGQGVMSAGILLANCAIREGHNATWLPSYGPEMRGGTANAGVIMSSDPIGSPVVDRPNALIAMNGPSLDAFESTVQPDGLIVADSTMVKRAVGRTDVKVLMIPATETAASEGFVRGANVIMLTVYLLESGCLSMETLKRILPLSLTKAEYAAPNLRMIERGMELHAGRV